MINTVGELMEYLEENTKPTDQVCFEHVDENGDVQDLYPLTIDLIQLDIVKDTSEIRFCRGNQADWNLQKKQDEKV